MERDKKRREVEEAAQQTLAKSSNVANPGKGGSAPNKADADGNIAATDIIVDYPNFSSFVSFAKEQAKTLER
jgi:hypothetical protein